MIKLDFFGSWQLVPASIPFQFVEASSYWLSHNRSAASVDDLHA